MKQINEESKEVKQIKQQIKEDNMKMVALLEKSKKKSKILPFRLLMCAQSRGGKTYLVLYFIEQLLKEKKFKSNQIVWVSTTAHLDPQQLGFMTKHEIPILNEATEEYFRDVLEKQKNCLNRGQPMKPKLFVFDDMISESMFSQKQNTFLKKFSTSGRHYQISIILLLQHLSCMPLAARNQLSHICLGMTPDREKLLEWLYKYKGKLSKIEIENMYDEARLTNNGYGFLMIKTEKNGEEMYSQNLDVKDFE